MARVLGARWLYLLTLRSDSLLPEAGCGIKKRPKPKVPEPSFYRLFYRVLSLIWSQSQIRCIICCYEKNILFRSGSVNLLYPVCLSGFLQSPLSLLKSIPSVPALIRRTASFSALNSQSVQPVFTNSVEYINLAEPVNGISQKRPRQLKLLCRRFYPSSAFHNNQFAGKAYRLRRACVFYYSRQLCLLVISPLQRRLGRPLQYLIRYN